MVANLNFYASAAPKNQNIADLVSNMSLEEKVGQMFIVRTNTLQDPSLLNTNTPGSNEIIEINYDMIKTIEKYSFC